MYNALCWVLHPQARQRLRKQMEAISGVLWSDPQRAAGAVFNERRGAGVQYVVAERMKQMQTSAV